ncbi:hypothetical protein ACFE04_017651 [Oxalis oulophora]
MEFELRMAKEKLEKEQREMKLRAKLKHEIERKAKDENKKRADAIEAHHLSRRLDQAQLNAEERQKMDESLISRKEVVVFSQVLKAKLIDGFGDKIKLPPLCFKQLSDQGAFDQGPLHFQLSAAYPSDSEHDQKHRTTHSGVLEFTADENSVGLPPHVWNNLFPADDTSESRLVEVRYVQLQKGTYAQLQPDGIGFSDLPNHKALLETILRRHTTLSQDDVLVVNYGNLSYKLRVLELKPSTSISVLETDIEVDIVSPEEGLESKNQYILKQLKFGESESGWVEEGNYMYYKFTVDDGFSENVEIKIEQDNIDGGDTDIYVSKHPLLFPNRHQHEWSSHDIGSKILILGPNDMKFGSGTYSVGLYGFSGTTTYKISVSVLENKKIGQQAVSSSSMEEDAVECFNCKHSILSRNIVLHEAFCSRHNVVCQHGDCGIVLRVNEAKNHVHCNKCEKGFQVGEMEKHMKVFHEPLSCPCGVVLEKAEMVQHQSSICPLRLEACRFCGDMVQAGNSAINFHDRLRGLSEHESFCGSRTAPCDSCGRSVMLKDMDVHQTAVHQKK